jgi:hypothetical protein
VFRAAINHTALGVWAHTVVSPGFGHVDGQRFIDGTSAESDTSSGVGGFFQAELSMTGVTLVRPPGHRFGRLDLFLALILALCLADCGNSCFVFVSNPSNGTLAVGVGTQPLACPPPKPTPVVRVILHMTRSCESCSDSNRIAHAFVNIDGIQAHYRGDASDDPSHWQELLPELAKQPREIDLMSTEANNREAEAAAGGAEIPSGIYDQLRLTLIQNRESASVQLPVEDPCGDTGFNCVIMADGRAEALLFDGGESGVRVSLGATGNLLVVPPGSNLELRIELAPVWSLVESRRSGARLLPVLTGSVRIERK